MKQKVLLTLAALLLAAAPLFAQNDDKPFAEAFIVLQLSDADPEVQARVIRVLARCRRPSMRHGLRAGLFSCCRC